MKNILSKVLITGLLGGLISCKEDFINLAPLSNQTSSTFFKTADDFKQGVNAIYDGLQSPKTYGKTFYYLAEVRSDNTDIGDRGANAGIASHIDLFTEITTNPFLSDGYSGFYIVISRANAVLDQIDNSTINEAQKKQFKGEALFLRGLAYFNLVRFFGDIPLVTKVQSPTESLSNRRNAVAEVYTQIESDLNTAASLLPNTYAQTDLGRATADAAQALLGKVYVTQKKWDPAIAALQKVSSNHKLLENFADLFKTTTAINEETLFAVRFKKGLSPSEGNTFFNDMMPRIYVNGVSYSGATNNRPTKSIVGAFASNDKRFVGSLDTVYQTSATAFNRGNYIKKYLDLPSTTGDQGSSVPVIRYAEVLLLLAEAQNEKGYQASGSAFDNLNAVRARAGLAARTSADLPNQEAFRDAIFAERRVELAFENDRWFDLIRYGKGLAILQKHLLDEYNLSSQVLTAARFLFPLPQTEIEVYNNPATFPQNPGY